MKDDNYLTAGFSVKSWFLSLDHKRVAVLYLWAVTAFFFIGVLAAVLMRLAALTPNGLWMEAESYNKLFTMHGVIMIYLFLFPALFGVMGNFLTPLMLGTDNLSYPRLNVIGWYLYILGGIAVMAAVILGGVDTGWTFSLPYSDFHSTNVTLMTSGILLAALSIFLLSVNFVATLHQKRPAKMIWPRLPLFLWSEYAASLIFIVCTPALVTAFLLARGGTFDHHPTLYQHLFWLYAHPATYASILPAIGMVSEIVPCFARKAVFGPRFIRAALFLFAALSLLGWGEHMVVSGESTNTVLFFSVASLFIAVPLAIIVANWTATLSKGSIHLETPMLYALGFIGLLGMGVLTGIFLGAPATHVHLHNTHFVLAHFHYIMVGGIVMAYLGGVHFWWPKFTGKRYPEFWGKLSAIIIFIGVNLTFFPPLVAGYIGLVRRSLTYPPEFQVLNVLSTAGASILIVGYAMPLFYLLWSAKYGPAAGANPWEGNGLEWQTSSPPPKNNFL